MKVLYFDTFSGLSGDMALGLLVDLGVPKDLICQELAELPVEGWSLTAQPDQRHGIGGTRVTVSVDSPQPQRTWSDIDQMLAHSALRKTVKDRARKIFRCLGEAESVVHRKPLEQVHFHEVGSVDAIVDIVGTAIGLEHLAVDQVVCSPLPLSTGLTSSQHGRIPLPAPATLEILKGQPVRDAGCAKELVTPTGAAIAASVARFGAMPDMLLDQVGYGVGGWQLDDRPNLLRGILGRVSCPQGMETDQVTVIESHLDDCPAEWLGTLMDRLIAEGALDIAYSPLQMKKNRPGMRLTAIAEPAHADRLARTILRETSAIGVRLYEARRRKFRRDIQTIDTEWGAAEVKLIYDGEQLLRITPEHASCVRLAETYGRPLPEIYRLVSAAANRQFGLE
ncbi:MAG: nickel pincer cofactor biosynthesis protein LarC [Deltaproteobacteria bacterium]|jgi:uncharacterized protein (TIGR00299 family) protein|nr:nickel pincer cofactor biosynthesis protein LarC [Deltaproteobacteria bacterium]